MDPEDVTTKEYCLDVGIVSATSDGKLVEATALESYKPRLTALGLWKDPVLVGAEDVVQGKPHPEGYLQAAQALGVAARRCVVVEDAPAGVEAARAAGMTVAAVLTTHGRDRLAADRHVQHLGALCVEIEGDDLVLQFPAPG